MTGELFLLAVIIGLLVAEIVRSAQQNAAVMRRLQLILEHVEDKP